MPGPDAVACSDLFDSLSLEFYYTLLHIRRLRFADPHPDGQHVVLPCCFVNFDYVLYFDEFDCFQYRALVAPALGSALGIDVLRPRRLPVLCLFTLLFMCPLVFTMIET